MAELKLKAKAINVDLISTGDYIVDIDNSKIFIAASNATKKSNKIYLVNMQTGVFTLLISEEKEISLGFAKRHFKMSENVLIVKSPDMNIQFNYSPEDCLNDCNKSKKAKIKRK